MQAEDSPMRVINHKSMRQIIGLIAIQMPIVVVLLSGRPELSSISISYWTDSRDIFVGSLIAVAFFLSAYNGTGTCRKDTEFWLSKVACVSAIFVALFPTTDFDKCPDCAPAWTIYLSDLIFLKPHQVHHVTSILLFICLILLMSFFSLRAKNKGAISRAKIYFGLSLGMLLGMPIVFVTGKLTGLFEPVFWVEFVGLWLFGVGWFIAGWYKTKPEKPVPEGAIRLGELEVDPSVRHFPTGIDVEEARNIFFRQRGAGKTGSWHVVQMAGDLIGIHSQPKIGLNGSHCSYCVGMLASTMNTRFALERGVPGRFHQKLVTSTKQTESSIYLLMTGKKGTRITRHWNSRKVGL